MTVADTLNEFYARLFACPGRPSGAVVVGTGRNLLRSEPPMFAVRYKYQFMGSYRTQNEW